MFGLYRACHVTVIYIKMNNSPNTYPGCHLVHVGPPSGSLWNQLQVEDNLTVPIVCHSSTFCRAGSVL